VGVEVLPWVFTSGWASGINAYAVVLIMGLVERFAHVSQVPDALARTDVLIGAGVMFVLEMVADKIPYIDSAWDSIHTVIRPAIGATLGYLLGHDGSTLDAAFTAATGGVSALLSHTVKAGLHAAINTSPEPVSNVVVSTAEDVTVTGVVALAFANPWISAGIALALLVAGAILVLFLLKRIRAYKKGYDAWGVRMGSAKPRLARADASGDHPSGSPPPGRGSSPPDGTRALPSDHQD